MEMNVTGISPMDGVTPVSSIGTYPAIPNSGVNKVKPKAEDLSQPAVKLTLSPEAKKLLKSNEAANEAAQSKDLKCSAAGKELSKADQEALRKLQTRDLHVRIHEQQHLAIAGPYAKGGPSFSFQIGPDGKTYAIGGEVQLDISPVPNNSQATIAKAQVIRRSALAPADPSGADRAIAASASQMEARARMDLAQEAKLGIKSQEPGSTSKTSDSSCGTDNSTGKKQIPFQFKAYQRMMNCLGVKIGRHLNFQV